MTTSSDTKPQGDESTEDKPQGESTEQKPPQGEQQPPQGSSSSDDTDWKAEARKWEKAAKKDAAEKAKADAALEQIQNLLSGKDQEATEAQKRAAAAELEAIKYRIAYEAGLPPDLAERLKGSTADELKADAEALAKYAKATAKPKSDAKADDGGKGGSKKDPNALLREWRGS